MRWGARLLPDDPPTCWLCGEWLDERAEQDHLDELDRHGREVGHPLCTPCATEV